MESKTTSGVFDGKDARFTLTENDLRVECTEQEALEYSLDTLIAIADDEDGQNEILHLFRSKDPEGWKPKDLFYEKHTVKGLPSALYQELRLSKLPSTLLHPLEGSVNNWICISTRSGTGDSLTFFENALKPLLSSLNIRGLQTLETSSADSVTEFCRDIILPRANSGIDQTIILLSGDGGPVDMINVLLEGLDDNAKIPTLALIPTGTGNALAHSSGITKDKTLGVRTMLRGHPQPIPTFQVKLSAGSKFVTDEGNSRAIIPHLDKHSEYPSLCGVVVCSWGLHASLVADSDTTEYRKFGNERFKMAAEGLLSPKDGSGPHSYQGKVTIFQSNGERRAIGDSKHAYTLLTFASQLEQGFTISPASQPLDDRLRLIHFGPMSAEDTMKLMSLAYQGGKHVDDPSVQYEEVDGMRIDFEEEDERWRQICIDGKIIAIDEGGWIEVRKRRTLLNLIAP